MTTMNPARVERSWACTKCGHVVARWLGKCPSCGSWTTVAEVFQGTIVGHDDDGSPLVLSKMRQSIPIVHDTPEPSDHPDDAGDPDDDIELPIPITAVSREYAARFITNIPALDHVLGGGLVPGGSVLIGGDPGSAKCLGRGTLVLMYDGRTMPVESILIGDLLMSPDGTSREVLAVTQGFGDLFRIEPIKGEPWICNGSHILTLVHSKTDEVFDMELDNLLGQTDHSRIKHYAKLFSVGITRFEREDNQPIDPYFLGVWFGDGTKDLKSVSITKPDPEILELCNEIAVHWGLRVKSYESNRCPTHRLVSDDREGTQHRVNRLLIALRDLVGPSITMPTSYTRAPQYERLQFLAGLLDTDGELSSNCFSITQKREDWAREIWWMSRSLGLCATIMARKGHCKRSDGTIFEGDYWRVSISGDTDRIPTRIARKKATPREQKKVATRTGFAIEPIGPGDYFGFTLDGDGRFLLGDFTVTHNSTLAIQAAAACARWNEARVLYVTGEENPAQVAERADRVGASFERVYLIRETDPDRILRSAERIEPEVIVIDSINTMARLDLDAMPGSVTQVRACAELLHTWCRDHHVALILIGQVTKDGAVAGPSALKHLVDAVLHLDPIEDSQLRVLRAHKNRYGDTGCIGRFVMSGKGLESVTEPDGDDDPCADIGHDSDRGVLATPDRESQATTDVDLGDFDTSDLRPTP